MTTPAFKRTALWKGLRGIKRMLTPPSAVDHCEGTITVDAAPAALAVGSMFGVQLTVTNTGPRAWPNRGRSAVLLVARFLTPQGQPFGPASLFPLPAVAYPGEPVWVPRLMKAPDVVGDFTLEFALDRPSEVRPARLGMPVVGPRSRDIDYHAVYRTADLDQNHWWVVGGYYTREQYEQSSRERLGTLIGHAGLTPDSRVLDIGCGTGQMGDALADYLTDCGAYFGTDIGEEAVAFCQRRFRRPNFRFARGTMTGVPFTAADGPFDVAIFFSVFTHTFLDESVLLLAEARRLLAPAGVVVADVITSELVERAAGNRGEMVVNAGHFLNLADALGLTATVIGRWPWNPHAERLMLTLRPNA